MASTRNGTLDRFVEVENRFEAFDADYIEPDIRERFTTILLARYPKERVLANAALAGELGLGPRRPTATPELPEPAPGTAHGETPTPAMAPPLAAAAETPSPAAAATPAESPTEVPARAAANATATPRPSPTETLPPSATETPRPSPTEIPRPSPTEPSPTETP